MTTTLAAWQDASLLGGWVPGTVQAVTAGVVVVTLVGRQRNWWTSRFPLALAVGAAGLFLAWTVVSVRAYPQSPPSLWWGWIGACCAVVGIVVLGWRGSGRPRRALSVVALVLCSVCALLATNLWFGYARTVSAAWNQLASGPLPYQAELTEVRKMAARGIVPTRGRIVPVDIPNPASGFAHRREYVYLPPAWFATNPPQALPIVLMVGAEYGSSADWVVAGRATEIADAFAATHGGRAPILVFVDKGGAFNQNTQCVNGVRGRVEDHLVLDVLPFVKRTFGAREPTSAVGVVGWSMGGTCALQLTVRHPDVFSTTVAISGRPRPDLGDEQRTIAGLFGGDAVAFAAYDSVATLGGRRYDGVAAKLVVDEATTDPDLERAAAENVCAAARSSAMDCRVEIRPGRTGWPFAADTFAATLPWLTDRLLAAAR